MLLCCSRLSPPLQQCRRQYDPTEKSPKRLVFTPTRLTGSHLVGHIMGGPSGLWSNRAQLQPQGISYNFQRGKTNDPIKIHVYHKSTFALDYCAVRLGNDCAKLNCHNFGSSRPQCKIKSETITKAPF